MKTCCINYFIRRIHNKFSKYDIFSHFLFYSQTQRRESNILFVLKLPNERQKIFFLFLRKKGGLNLYIYLQTNKPTPGEILSLSNLSGHLSNQAIQVALNFSFFPFLFSPINTFSYFLFSHNLPNIVLTKKTQTASKKMSKLKTGS